MRIGVQFDTRGKSDVEALLDDFVRAEEDGFESVWLGQVFDQDVLTLLAMAGLRTRSIELGTSVVPLPTRHITVLAQQALTTQLASGGRLCLGVGAGHGVILDKKLGLPSDRPLARTRESLQVLGSLLRGEYVKFAGEYERIRVGTPVTGARPPGVILAALGPRMIELAGELCDGVTLVFAGERFVSEQVRPRLPGAARIVACLPIAMTEAPEAQSAAVDAYTAPSTVLPAYQRALAQQNVDCVSELSVIGGRAALEDGLDALAAAGVTDLNPILLSSEADPGCARRTREWLADRARQARLGTNE
jgi:F420-dependent oxidoreductase-like protein